MPEWYTRALADRATPQTCITFAADFIAAAAAEREQVIGAWDRSMQWARPNPWRLACHDEFGSLVHRVRAELLFEALDFVATDMRESLMHFAVVHNACVLADLFPVPVFEAIAASVGGAAGGSLRSFAHRRPEYQSMEAFRLRAVANPGGGYEIRCDW